MRALVRSLLLLLCLCGAAATAAQPGANEAPVRVFAAASLTDALTEVAARWQALGHPAPSLAFGASSTLARQIAAGAPADVFASADLQWMDHVEQRGRLAPGTRTALLGNTLVLIAPKGRDFPVAMQPGFDFARALRGRLCMGEPDTVPAGIYARESLQHLGWWPAVRERVIGTDDVRTALAFVERGECAAGIVYATDARISRKVAVIAAFPESSHPPIRYPVAAVVNARPQTAAFLRFLQSPPAAAIFRRHGFDVLAH